MGRIGLMCRVVGSNFAQLCRKLIGVKFTYRIKSLISPFSSLRTFGKGRIYFGNKLEIRPNTELTARNGDIKIGNNCFINRNCMIVAHESITIEDNVTIGPGTVIYDHDHDGKGGYDSKPVKIESGAWIGANVVILRGTTIGANSVVAAGSVVINDVSPNTVFVQKRVSSEFSRG